MLFRGFSISLIVLICTLTTSANAEVTVTLSDRMARAFDQNGVGAKTVSKRLNDEFNLGLKELGKTNPAAKALFESGQTIRIVCAKGKEAKDLGIDVGVFAPAETVGDFNKDGSPKQGGTAVIGIRCKELQIHGLDEEFYDIDPRSTGFKILIHELLHATNKARRHPPDKLEDYHEFVDKFVSALESAKEEARKEARRGRRSRGRDDGSGRKSNHRRKSDLRQSSIPQDPAQQQDVGFASGTRFALDFNLSTIGGTGAVDPTFGNALSASNSTTEFSVGADLRLPFGQLSEGVSVIGGAWAKVFPEGDKTIAVLERHPTPGLDTRVLQNQLAFIFLYTGIQIQKIGQQLGDGNLCATGALLCDAALTLFLGPRIQINQTILETDETGGGGARERFDSANAALGFTVGADLDFPLTTSGPLQTFLRIGAAIDFTPETTVRGRSGLGFDYDGRIEGNVDGRFFVGFGVELPAGTYASDRRLKKNVELLGRHSSGLTLYRYQYVWGGPEWIGVMAQEVATRRPDAVVNAGDYLAVDYAKLGILPIVIIR